MLDSPELAGFCWTQRLILLPALAALGAEVPHLVDGARVAVSGTGDEPLHEPADVRLPTCVRRIVLEGAHGGVEIVALDQVEQVATAAPDRPLVNADPRECRGEVVRDASMILVVIGLRAGMEDGVQSDTHGRTIPAAPDDAMGPMRWLEVAPPGAATSLVLGSHPAMTPGSQQGVLLTTSDIDGDCTRLRDAGVELEGPDDMPWGRQATFRDPDGNGFVLSAV